MRKLRKDSLPPDEFVTQYSAFLMSRIKDKELIECFNKMPEDELDQANDYYLQNERINKFNADLRAIKRKCKTKSQKKAFNELLTVFCKQQ